MLFYLIVIIFILVFLITFSLTFLFLLKKEIIMKNLYIIIPAICIFLWAFYALYDTKFKPHSGDFKAFYNAGKQVFIDPLRIYVSGFVYMPNMAFLFSISIALFPYSIAYNIFLIINYVSALLILKEYDKVLILMDVKQKIQRFMFLMIISNGVYVYQQFYINQTKYLFFFLLIFILRREIQFNKQEKIKDLKFYLINYGLFILAIGMAPYFIFILLIYIFQDIHIKELLNKENIQKYIIVILMFCAQNFVFIINPSQFFIFINFFNIPHQRNDIFVNLIYLRNLIIVPSHLMPLFTIFFVIAISIISLILIFKKELLIQEKFGFFFLAYIFFGIYSLQHYLYLLLYSFVLLLFVPFLEKNIKGFEWVKGNKFFIMGILSITLILNRIFNVTILLSIMMISLILLYIKEKNFEKLSENVKINHEIKLYL